MPFVHGLFCETRGEGTPCVAIHGGLGLDHVYMRTLAPLEDVLRITYYDQRGNGRSDRQGVAVLTIESLADDAAALIREVVGGPAIVLGHSYGGFVAQELALRHPGLVRGLVLVDTTAGQLGREEIPPEDGPPLPPEAIQILSRPPESDSEFEEQILALFGLIYLKRLSLEDVRPALEGTVFSADTMVRGFEVLSQWSSIDRLSAVSAPTLLLWGRDDLMCSLPQAGRIASRLPNSELAVFDECGHFPWLEAPDAFFEAVRRWLARHGLTSG